MVELCKHWNKRLGHNLSSNPGTFWVIEIIKFVGNCGTMSAGCTWVCYINILPVYCKVVHKVWWVRPSWIQPKKQMTKMGKVDISHKFGACSLTGYDWSLHMTEYHIRSEYYIFSTGIISQFSSTLECATNINILDIYNFLCDQRYEDWVKTMSRLGVCFTCKSKKLVEITSFRTR